MNRISRATIVAALALALSACGGGGGGGDDSGSTGKTLSGRISVAETAAVDSDLNDIRQTGYVSNTNPAAPQSLSSPVLLVGTVNEAGTGPAGTNQTQGDLDDYFRIDLVAGQVVELEFAADPAVSDVDLYIFNTSGAQVGASTGGDTRFECVRIATTGTYIVDVFAYLNASIYNLRIGAPGTASSCAASTSSTRAVPDQLMAKPKALPLGASQAFAATLQSAGIQTLAHSGDGGPQLLQLPATAAARAASLDKLSPGFAKSGQKAAPAGATVPAEIELLKFAKRLRATGAYEYVEPNWIMEQHALVGTYPPNDRGYPYQRWHYEQIEVPAAMERITGLSPLPTQRPIVAVIDDGVVLRHPDFIGQLVAGRTFVTSENNVGNGDNLSRPQDNPVFHGTHVAGTIAAATFDGIGAASVAPMAQIMPLRVFATGSGGASSFDIVSAMRYAAGLGATQPARKADVINMSLGSDRACDATYSSAIADVRAAGVVVVVSAGNSGNNVAVGSPANCPGAIAVSATEARKAITGYSNTGTAVKVAAPGGDTSQSTTGTGAPDGVFSDVATFDGGVLTPAFGPMQGTSMAAPHVSGVMALMRYINPNLTVTAIDNLITGNNPAGTRITDDLGSAGFDTRYGHGLINARKAVEAALASINSPTPAPAGQVVASPSAIDFGSFQTTAALDLAVNGTTSETVTQVVSSSPAVTFTGPGGNGLGRYTVNVNRALLGASGSYFPTLTFTLSSARTIVVQISVQKTASGSAATGSYGPVYVLLIDPDANTVDTVLAEPAAGGYTWTKTGYTGSRVSVVAGGDLDNDDLICAQGEPCGAFPVLPPGSDLTVIDLSGDRSGLDFQVAPLSGMSVASVGSSPAKGWRKQVADPAHVTPVTLPLPRKGAAR